MLNDNHDLQQKEWGFEDYLDLILRKIWLILAIFVVVFSATLYYALTRPSEYASSITFSIDQETQYSGLASRTSTPYSAYYSRMAKNLEYYQAMINSQPFRNSVIERAQKDSVILQRGGITREQIVSILGSGLSISKEEYSNLMYMRVKAYDPVIAFRLADIASNAFKERSREIEQEQSQNVVEYVNQQTRESEKSLEKAERELQEFKSRTQFTMTGENEGILQRLNQIENKITEIETQRQLAQANLETYNKRIEQLQGDEAVSLFDVESPRINQLRSSIDKLQEKKHALLESDNYSQTQLSDLERQISSEKNTLRNAMLEVGEGSNEPVLGAEEDNALTVLRERKINEELNLYSLQNEEKFYKQLRDNYREQHPNILDHAIKLAKLQRAKTVAENLYSFLTQQGEEAKIRAETGTGGILIVSPPMLPNRPVPKNTARNIAIGVILGLGLGIGIAFAVDYFDKSIRYPDEVERITNLTVIASIPDIEKAHKKKSKEEPSDKANGKLALLSKNGKNSIDYRLLPMIGSKNPLVESYRNLRTDLQFVNVDEPVSKILITSSMPGEGKTLTSANLAISYAELGKKVLIVDADMRKPMQHKVFELEKTPGLSDCLARDNVSIESAIRPTLIGNLQLLPSGTTPPNPAEMLDSQRMNDLLLKLYEMYDMVIFDTPPLMVVSDPRILASKVGNVLLVARAHQVTSPALKNGVSRLDNVRTKIIGVVLNGIGRSKGYGYYYKYNYYYNYNYYYYSYSEGKKKRKKKQTVV